MLSKLQDPGAACGMVHLCKSGHFGVEEIVENVLSSIPNMKSRNEVRSKLLKICSLLPPTQNFYCRSLFKSNSESQSASYDETPRFVIPCKKCEDFIQLLYASFSNVQTRTGIQFALGMACSSIPDLSTRDECVGLVKEYFDEFWNIVLDELEMAVEICHVVGCVDVPTTTVITSTTADTTTTTIPATTVGKSTTSGKSTTAGKSTTTGKSTTAGNRQQLGNRQHLGNRQGQETRSLTDLQYYETDISHR